jgi:hypothetical protein
VVRPTGAGGGDLLLAVFDEPGDAARFRASARASNLTVVSAGVDLRGVRLAQTFEAH